MDAVGNIIAEREKDRLPWAPASLLAFLLHAAVLAGLLVSVLAKPIRYAPPRAVQVRLLPAGAMRVAAPVQQAEPAPPPEAPKPKIEKPPPPEEQPKPSKNALLLPAKEDKKKKPTPPPVSRPGPAAAPAVSLPSAGEEQGGSAASGAVGPGATAGIGGMKLDQADFQYPSYVRQMLGIISENWFKPVPTLQTNPVVHFQIERDGAVTNPQIVVTSGLPFVDRAALRAVLASSLPPLPQDYGSPRLGVTLTFE